MHHNRRRNDARTINANTHANREERRATIGARNRERAKKVDYPMNTHTLSQERTGVETRHDARGGRGETQRNDKARNAWFSPIHSRASLTAGKTDRHGRQIGP